MPKNENQLDALLKLAASRLGTTPEKLKESAENGTLAQQMQSNMSGSDSENLQKVLADPDAAQKLLASPQAQAILKLIQKDK